MLLCPPLYFSSMGTERALAFTSVPTRLMKARDTLTPLSDSEEKLNDGTWEIDSPEVNLEGSGCQA